MTPRTMNSSRLFEARRDSLPEYITRKVEDWDADRYQCIFAKNDGAVMAPAAGLHFSRELLKRLEIKGVERGFLTLHSGRGNFKDIDVEDLTKHRMDSEEMFVNEELVEIGTGLKTEIPMCVPSAPPYSVLLPLRVHERQADDFEGWTNKFIFPPYDFTVCNSLVSTSICLSAPC